MLVIRDHSKSPAGSKHLDNKNRCALKRENVESFEIVLNQSYTSHPPKTDSHPCIHSLFGWGWSIGILRACRNPCRSKRAVTTACEVRRAVTTACHLRARAHLRESGERVNHLHRHSSFKVQVGGAPRAAMAPKRKREWEEDCASVPPNT